MKKPQPVDFGLNEQNIHRFEKVESDFYRDRDAKS